MSLYFSFALAAIYSFIVGDRTTAIFMALMAILTDPHYRRQGEDAEHGRDR